MTMIANEGNLEGSTSQKRAERGKAREIGRRGARSVEAAVEAVVEAAMILQVPPNAKRWGQ